VVNLIVERLIFGGKKIPAALKYCFSRTTINGQPAMSPLVHEGTATLTENDRLQLNREVMPFIFSHITPGQTGLLLTPLLPILLALPSETRPGFLLLLAATTVVTWAIRSFQNISDRRAQTLSNILGSPRPHLDELGGQLSNQTETGTVVYVDTNMSEHLDLLARELARSMEQEKPTILVSSNESISRKVTSRFPQQPTFVLPQNGDETGAVPLAQLDQLLREQQIHLATADLVAYEGVEFDPAGLPADSPFHGSSYIYIRAALNRLLGVRKSIETLWQRMQNALISGLNA
jgi:hypothetical protein